jgi:hypothetical protein
VSASPIKSIKTAEWLNSDGTPDTLDAPALLSLSVKGNMTTDLKVGMLGKVSVGGAITGATIRSEALSRRSAPARFTTARCSPACATTWSACDDGG